MSLLEVVYKKVTLLSILKSSLIGFVLPNSQIYENIELTYKDDV